MPADPPSGSRSGPNPVAGRTRRLCLIVNPAAGRRHGGFLRRVLAGLAARGVVVKVCETTAPRDAERMAGAVACDDFDAIVVAGGDGTINEVLNGLRATSPALGIIPMGTANVLAAEIGLPSRAPDIAATLAAGPVRDIWAADIDGRRFVQMAGVGFDAAVVDGVDLALKRHVGKAAYALKALQLLRRYDFPTFDLDIDGTAVETASAIIANGRLYAGRYVCAPAASLHEPTFEVCLFADGGARSVMSYAAALWRGRLHRHPQVSIVRGRQVTIAAPPGAPVQIDGDRGGTVPATLRAGAVRIPVIHPLPAGTGSLRP